MYRHRVLVSDSVPESLQQLIIGKYLSRILGEQSENIELFRGKRNQSAVNDRLVRF